MTNKIKSLIYLSCFIFASVVYNFSLEQTATEELAQKTIEQEADIVVSPFFEDID